MKIIFLGGTSSLAYKAYTLFSKNFDTYVTFRNFNDKIRKTNYFDENKIINGFDAFETENISQVIKNLNPNIVINCIRLTKEMNDDSIRKNMIYINSLFPHILAGICTEINCKLIHFSTDCVFSGKKGNYSEGDFTDAENLYGKTKYLGEIDYGQHLTIRTSKVGKSLFGDNGLVDWFINEVKKGNEINGFTNAIYNGFSTTSLSRELLKIVKHNLKLKGLYHLSAEKISKYKLLLKISEKLNLNAKIKKYDKFYCDRSLNCSKYKKVTVFIPPDWKAMVEEITRDYE
jgi:dTDP-4-dehydrorhamnose reductase